MFPPEVGDIWKHSWGGEVRVSKVIWTNPAKTSRGIEDNFGIPRTIHKFDGSWKCVRKAEVMRALSSIEEAVPGMLLEIKEFGVDGSSRVIFHRMQGSSAMVSDEADGIIYPISTGVIESVRATASEALRNLKTTDPRIGKRRDEIEVKAGDLLSYQVGSDWRCYLVLDAELEEHAVSWRSTRSNPVPRIRNWFIQEASLLIKANATLDDLEAEVARLSSQQGEGPNSPELPDSSPPSRLGEVMTRENARPGDLCLSEDALSLVVSMNVSDPDYHFRGVVAERENGEWGEVTGWSHDDQWWFASDGKLIRENATPADFHAKLEELKAGKDATVAKYATVEEKPEVKFGQCWLLNNGDKFWPFLVDDHVIYRGVSKMASGELIDQAYAGWEDMLSLVKPNEKPPCEPRVNPVAFQCADMKYLPGAEEWIAEQKAKRGDVADDALETILADIRKEVISARKKFPGNLHQLVAKIEEDGELADTLHGCEGPDRVRVEATQSAAMAIRCALDGDSDVLPHDGQTRAVTAYHGVVDISRRLGNIARGLLENTGARAYRDGMLELARWAQRVSGDIVNLPGWDDLRREEHEEKGRLDKARDNRQAKIMAPGEPWFPQSINPRDAKPGDILEVEFTWAKGAVEVEVTLVNVFPKLFLVKDEKRLESGVGAPWEFIKSCRLVSRKEAKAKATWWTDR